MKEIVEKVEYDNITYHCEFEGCNFFSSIKSETRLHEVGHNLVDSKTILGQKYYKFDSKESARKYLEYEAMLFCETPEINWEGPGWYYFHTSDKYDSFSCSSTANILYLKNICQLIPDLENAIEELRQMMDKS